VSIYLCLTSYRRNTQRNINYIIKRVWGNTVLTCFLYTISYIIVAFNIELTHSLLSPNSFIWGYGIGRI